MASLRLRALLLAVVSLSFSRDGKVWRHLPLMPDAGTRGFSDSPSLVELPDAPEEVVVHDASNPACKAWAQMFARNGTPAFCAPNRGLDAPRECECTQD